MTPAAIRLRITWLVAVVLVLGLCALTPLCHASPPDPTWIGGLYDGADYDDVVLEVIGAVAVPAAAPLQLVAPAVTRQDETAVGREAPTKRSLVTRLDRAPPLA
jgi:hypothetical protein